jgi:hypothetical protein
MNITGAHCVARMYVSKQYISLKFTEILYLQNIINIIQNQHPLHKPAQLNVMPHASTASQTKPYAEPILALTKRFCIINGTKN